MADAKTLVDLLEVRAAEQPDRLGYCFVSGGDRQGGRRPSERSLTYSRLDEGARAVAARLAEAGAGPGTRTVVLLPPGLDYVTAFFGCLYAGTVAVPVYPPDLAQLERTLPRLRAVVRDCAAVAAVGPASVIPLVASLAAQAPELGTLRWVAGDGPARPGESGDPVRPTHPDLPAMLQYTSGSTSSPKGVVLTHRNLLHNSGLIRRFFATSPESRGFVWLPPYHDMGLIGGLIQPLYAGFPVTLMSPQDFLTDPLRWLRAICERGITISGGPNFAYDLCVRRASAEDLASLDLSTWRVAFNGAEPVRTETLERFAAAFAPTGFRAQAFLPCYGLAEATLLVSAGSAASRAGQVSRRALEAHRVAPPTAPDDTVRLASCGDGGPDVRTVVVDPTTLAPCGSGQVGEVWVASASVASGYWNRPEESAAVFGARLADGEGPFLRTGDLGFVRDGELVVTGRLNDLVVVRGQNHYPQDLELTAETAVDLVRPGCVAAFLVDAPAEPAEQRLVVVAELARHAAAPGADVDAGQVVSRVRQAIAARHGLQVHSVVLIRAGGLPKTSSGKVQRRECRSRYLAGALPVLFAAGPVQAPRPAPERRTTSLEDHLRDRLAEVCDLPVEEIDPRQPLLSAGLDSLGAVRLKDLLAADLGVDLPLDAVLGGAALTDVAGRLAQQIDSQQRGARAGTAPGAGADAAAGHGLFPASHGQRALHVLHALEPDASAHTVAVALRCSGPVDPAAARRALEALVARHEALRTTFVLAEGDLRQHVHEAAPAGFRHHDVPALDPDALRRDLTEAAQRPFDLERGPLLRLELFSHPDGDVLLLAAHHIVTDFASMAVLAREFGACYAQSTGGPPVALPAVTATVHDVAAAQHALLDDPDSAARLAHHWDAQLADGVPPLAVPRLGDGSAEEGGHVDVRLSAGLTRRLRARAAQERVTLFVLLLTAYQAMLHEDTGRDDVVVGTPLAARGRAAFADVVGYCMNPVPIRSRLGGTDTFRDLLARTRAQVVDALEHQDYPMSLLAERHGLGHGRRGLFETLFVLNRPQDPAGEVAALAVAGRPGERRRLGPLEVERLPLGTERTPFLLELALAELGPALCGSLRFRADVLDTSSARRWVQRFEALLDDVASDPRRPLAGRPPRPDLVALLAQQVERAPDRVAVVAGTRSLTYRQLDQRANRLAHRLRGLGTGPESTVGVCLDRSPEALVALLGVLKASGAYVPLDGRHPADRLATVCADAGVGVVVTDLPLAHRMPSHLPRVVLDPEDGEVPGAPVDAPTPLGRPDRLAYVLYTSGSTGAPKGVDVTLPALANYAVFAAEHFGITGEDRVLQFASLAFDTSAEEIYPALLRGATLVLRDDEMLAGAGPFLQACAEQGVTVLDLPTAFWHDLVGALADDDSLSVPPSVRLVVLGGEAVQPDRVAAWHHRTGGRVRLVNTYGPTEATIVATAAELPAGAAPASSAAADVSIGRPVADVRALVLDEELRPVPVGGTGQIHLAGTGLARGYRARPGLTATAFVADPYGPPGGRLYRTGDIGRRLSDGSLEFVGRTDRQVKIRGQRVELEEIEAALRRHPDVQDAAVVLHRPTGTLVAHAVPIAHRSLDPEALRAFLRGTLPEYMVPTQLMPLKALPRSANGKTDHAALPQPRPHRRPVAAQEVPRDPREQALAGIWQEVLGVEQVGVQDDFFAMGGNSLLAVRMVARARQALGVDLPIRAVFDAPTIAALRPWLATRPAGDGAAEQAPIRRVPRDGWLPLSSAQERIWFLQQLDPGTTAYNVPRALRVHGPVDPRAVVDVFADLEARHEILRTTFPDTDGVPEQRIHAPRGIPVTVVDLSSLQDDEREPRAAELLRAAGQEVFDLAVGPLMRVLLLRLGPEEHILAVTEHHLVHDGWAQGVFLRDFLELYEARVTGRPARLPDLPVQYADFAAWQRETLTGERLEALLTFWRRRLAGAPGELRLPTDRPRPRHLGSRGDQETLVLDAQFSDALRGFSRDEDVTLFMTMFAAFSALLHGYSGQDDLVLATGVANRDRPELENLLGMMINTVLLRVDLSGSPSFRTLLQRVRRTCLEAYDHAAMPFERLVQALRPARDLSRMSLFQVDFSFLDTPMPELSASGLTFEVLDVHNRSAKFDLNIVVMSPAEQAHERGGTSTREITVLLEYNTDLFDAGTIREMLDRYEALLHEAVRRPQELVERQLSAVEAAYGATA